MHLEKLEIQGFKSFAPKTTIVLDKGMNAIVGPNGSGKSNIADAIRWVMGEQSMKSLRGKRAEDIIFAGSTQKGSMGMAEVSLYLNNEDGTMPVDFTSVVLTRRIYRNGDSEYLLNKSKVRLMDVQEMLAKAGFGSKTYSVIGQGMIDQILRSGPKERREMFEEAAGIKHYQIKRNASINKLDRSKDNLSRVGDLLNEIGPRRNSLKRQADRAEKKKEIKKELKVLQTEYFNHLWNKIDKKLAGVNLDVEKYRKEERNIEKGIEDLKEKIKKAEKNISFKSEDEKRLMLDKLINEKTELREKLALLSGRIEVEGQKDVSVSISEINDRKDRAQTDISKYNLDLKSFESEKKSAESEKGSSDKDLEGLSAKKIELEKSLMQLQVGASSEVSDDFTAEIKEIMKLQGDIFSDLDSCSDLYELEDLKNKAKKYQADINKLFDKINSRTSGGGVDTKKLTELQGQIGEMIEKKSSVESVISEYKVKLAVLDTKISSTNDLMKEAKASLEKSEQALSDIGSKSKGKNVALDNFIKDQGEAKKKLVEVDKNIESVSGELDQERKNEQENRRAVIELEQEYRDLQDKLNTTRNNRTQEEIKLARVENEKELLVDEIQDNTSLEKYDEYVSEFTKSPKMVEDAREQELKAKVSKYRDQIIRIGEIDPEVISEYEETEKRFTFLTDQKNDLEEAIKSLKNVITELDVKINKKFDIAFKKINVHFGKYFQTLFGGGRATLNKRKVYPKLTEEEVAAGVEEKSRKPEEIIEIKATPPGKKLKDLGMLSGGEKALTSIALLFAFITNNPAPFMVLDEVDAALDESNTGRYADIVASMADKSQFVTITHNRETMRRANLIYGVTMDQSGVSKLLSVKLDKLPNK